MTSTSNLDSRVVMDFINDRFSDQSEDARLDIAQRCQDAFREFDKQYLGKIVTNPQDGKEYVVLSSEMSHVFSHEHMHIVAALIDVQTRHTRAVEFCKGFFYWNQHHISTSAEYRRLQNKITSNQLITNTKTSSSSSRSHEHKTTKL